MSDFYKRQLTAPPAKELAEKSDSKKVWAYFELSDVLLFPDVRSVGREKLEYLVHQRAENLLSWLREVTATKILADISHVLEEHSISPEHMRHAHYGTSDNMKIAIQCEYKSQYVKLSGHYPLEKQPFSLTLTPARGYGVVERGWESVIFPQYYVLQVNSK